MRDLRFAAGLAAVLGASAAQAGDDLVISGVRTDLTVQSYIRLSNNEGAASTVRIRLHDAASGAAIATWTSPLLPGGGTYETWAWAMLAAADPPVNYATLPPTLVLSISGFLGHVQHAHWTPDTRTWAHVSSCGMVLMADPLSLPFVVGPGRAGLAGLVRVTNATAATRSLRVTFHDNDGAAYVWQSPEVTSYGAVATLMSTIAKETTPPIPAHVVSLMAMADAAPSGVALSYSEGLEDSTNFDDFSAACMSVTAAPTTPGEAPRTPSPAMPHGMD